MIIKLLIFILLFVSQAKADPTNHFAGFTGSTTIGQFQTVEANGNVGIGTASPSSQLYLYGTNNPAAMTLNSAGGGIDSNTQLMLHLDNNVTDSSQNNFTVTNNSVTFSSSTYEFGGYSGFFNGSGPYLSVPTNAVWPNGNNPFEWDAWVNWSSASAETTLFSVWQDGSNRYRFTWAEAASPAALAFYVESGGTQTLTVTTTSSFVPTVGQWYHIEIDYTGSAYYIFINGISQTINYLVGSGSTSLPSLSGAFELGRRGDATLYMNGYMDEVRYSNTYRHTSNFVPPTQPYSTMSSSQVILQETGTQEGKLWTDVNDSNKIKIDDATTTRLAISSGNVGIGTINPAALLDVNGTVRISTGLVTRGASPTIGTGSGDCGTSPSVTGNDISGTVTVGSGANGGECTITFSAVKSSTPNCICQNGTTANTYATSQSTTSFVCKGTLTAGDKLAYWCPQ